MDTGNEPVQESPLAKMIGGLKDEMNAVEEAAAKFIDQVEYIFGPAPAEKSDSNGIPPKEPGLSPCETQLEEVGARMVMVRDALIAARRRVRT